MSQRILSRRIFSRSVASSLILTQLGILSACSNNGSSNSSAQNPDSASGSPNPPPANQRESNIDNLGDLGTADENGVRLPPSFSSRIVARTGEKPVSNSTYVWHSAPDGGATFSSPDGWVYVSNSEVDNGLGGVGAIRFDLAGNILDSYSILDSTSRNCAGGKTPWGSWLSCEEISHGLVYECFPHLDFLPAPLPALGRFMHEAAAVDPNSNQLYLTEDDPSGLLYRFTPNTPNIGSTPDLTNGTLQALFLVDGAVSWTEIPDPGATSEPTRTQVQQVTRFNGGEGIVYYGGAIFFTTKGDNRVWQLDIANQQLTVIYDDDDYENPILTGVDNITTNEFGDLFVAEDGGDLQIVAVTQNNKIVPIIQLQGHNGSEITGPAFSPDGSRLYFSSQRGTTAEPGGVTFEVSGPFIV